MMKKHDLFLYRTESYKEYLGSFSDTTIKDIIYSQANALNHGWFRSWQEDGATYYDVGPKIFIVICEKK